MADQESAAEGAAKRKRPGKKQGVTGELTTIWDVKEGHEKQLREVLEMLQRVPWEDKARPGALIGTLHDSRWVLFDDDTRLMFSTNYDGEWDPYIEAFAEHSANLFDAVFAHVDSFPAGGMHDPAVIDYVLDHQVTAAEYMRYYNGTVHEIRRALALQEAFDRLLDAPRRQLGRPAMSDHLSSPRALADPAFDICDLFAFPSPERTGWLTLAMTVHSRADPATLFADDVLCQFRLRPASVAATGAQAKFAVGADDTEVAFDCTFSEPAVWPEGGRPGQRGTCTTPAHHEVSVTVNDRSGGEGDGLRMYAGLVSDPFIFQFESILETLKTGRMAFGEFTTNTMAGTNVLGLVVEIECSRWLGNSHLVAVVGETLAAGKRPVRLERVGRPEIKNIGMQWNGNDTVNRDIDVRDLYNQEDAFHVRQDYLSAYRARLSSNLTFYDGLDGKTDWPLDKNGNHPLVDFLLEDFLVVDVTKRFAEDSWFEIERAMLAGRPHETCGGRAPNDDFLDTYYTLFINAGNGPRISDGIDQATVPASDRFPYLAPPISPSPEAASGEQSATAAGLA